MSDLFGRLAARALGIDAIAEPRRVSRFERPAAVPPPAATPLAERAGPSEGEWAANVASAPRARRPSGAATDITTSAAEAAALELESAESAESAESGVLPARAIPRSAARLNVPESADVRAVTETASASAVDPPAPAHSADETAAIPARLERRAAQAKAETPPTRSDAADGAPAGANESPVPPVRQNSVLHFVAEDRAALEATDDRIVRSSGSGVVGPSGSAVVGPATSTAVGPAARDSRVPEDALVDTGEGARITGRSGLQSNAIGLGAATKRPRHALPPPNLASLPRAADQPAPYAAVGRGEPPALAVRRAPAESEREAVIHVHIGRIDLRNVPQPPPAGRKPPPAARPRLSLDAYLDSQKKPT